MGEQGEAIKVTRRLLISAGLDAAEADAFIEKLKSETISADGQKQQTTIESIDKKLQVLTEMQKKSPGRVENILTGAGVGLVTSFIYDGLKDDLAPQNKPSHDFRSLEVIQPDWMFAKNLRRFTGLEDTIRTALKNAKIPGRSNPMRAAVLLDAHGAIHRARGDLGSASNCYREALDISRKMLGPHDQSTAAAYSNLGLCFFAKGKYKQANELLSKGSSIMRDSLGDKDIKTAAVVFNLFFCLKAQGIIKYESIPQQLRQIIPKVLEVSNFFEKTKFLAVSAVALLEVVRGALAAEGLQDTELFKKTD